jgi:hypothetical protein
MEPQCPPILVQDGIAVQDISMTFSDGMVLAGQVCVGGQ